MLSAHVLRHQAIRFEPIPYGCGSPIRRRTPNEVSSHGYDLTQCGPRQGGYESEGLVIKFTVTSDSVLGTTAMIFAAPTGHYPEGRKKKATAMMA